MWNGEKQSGGVSPALEDDNSEFDRNKVSVSIKDLSKYVVSFLHNSGFNEEESSLTLRNLLEAELAGKASHGIIRLKDLRILASRGHIACNSEGLKLLNETSEALLFDAEYQSGSVAVYRSMEKAFSRIESKDSTLLMVGIRNMSYASGYIGDFAREAAEKGYIFLSFFNSPPILIPHGSKEAQWGTDPLSFSFPHEAGQPVIHDMASSKITWGEMMNCKREGRDLPEETALDEQGNPTLSPLDGMKGGLLSAGGHKGSGIALMVELLAGVLTGSRVGTVKEGGWGGCYFLIKPTIFGRNSADISLETSALLQALCATEPRNPDDPVRFPGMKAAKNRNSCIELDSIELPEKLWQWIVENSGST
jgi:LDH2 family malate/lactate/ureidoglycolate dehydrogenase